MSSCEKCWQKSGGNVERYGELIKNSSCTPQEQAGGDYAAFCPKCHKQTIHMYVGHCLSPDCSYSPLSGDKP